jgi:hypothetical protein
MGFLLEKSTGSTKKTGALTDRGSVTDGGAQTQEAYDDLRSEAAGLCGS